MVWIGDAAIQAAQLVEGEFLEIALVEVLREALLEVDGEAFVEEVQEGVDEGGGNGDETQVEDSLDKYCLVSLDNRFHYFTV